MSNEKRPLVVDLEVGKHALCTCGVTAKPPFCDGGHKGTDKKPVILDVDTAQRYAWCTCQASGKMPACDGNHKNL